MSKPGSIRTAALFASLAIALVVAPPVLAAPPGAVDTNPCIASDALGYRYIAFGRTGAAEPGIYVATNRTGTWRLGAHPVAAGERCAAMTIDGGRHIHLLGLRAIPNDPNNLRELRYSTNQTGVWRSSIVRVGQGDIASLALDRTGRPNIATRDEDGALLYERTATGGWAIRYSVTGRTSHIRADPGGDLWVMMSDAKIDRFVRLTDRSGVWVATRIPVPFNQQHELDLAIDASGRRYLAVHDSTTGNVAIYRDRGSSWPRTDRTREPAGRRLVEMEIEPAGAIHLLFWRDLPTRASVDLNRHGGSWHTQLVGYTSGFWPDIEIDRSGHVSAAFDRDGSIWSYWNPWTKPPSRFAISGL